MVAKAVIIELYSQHFEDDSMIKKAIEQVVEIK
jgi:hypothetical protein